MPGSSLTCQSNVGRSVTSKGFEHSLEFHGHMITIAKSCLRTITGAAHHVLANANTTMDIYVYIYIYRYDRMGLTQCNF